MRALARESSARGRGGAISRLPDADSSEALERSIAAARDALIGLQSAQGFWLFELEADCTIPAEYIMMMHFLDEIDVVLQEKLCGLPAPPPGRARRLAAVPGRGTRPQLHREGVLRAQARRR